MKKCADCLTNLPLMEFRKNKSRKDGLQHICTPCQKQRQRAYYQNHKQEYYEKSKQQKKEISEYVRSLKTQPCMDCGRSFPPCAMDFDHREGEIKIATVSKLRSSGNMKQIKKELEKCDLVCAVCHRIRTATRAGWVAMAIWPSQDRQ